MANAAQKKSLEAFIVSTKGKAGIVGVKDNKKILGDCGIVPKYLDQNSADIAHAKIMGKVGGKAKGGLTFDQYCNEFAVEIGTIISKKAKCEADAGKTKFLEALEAGAPKTTGTTKAQTGGATGRLTDTAGYTGAHKERFDKDGKGKGLEGREDKVANDGYVGNYKGDKTFDKTH